MWRLLKTIMSSPGDGTYYIGKCNPVVLFWVSVLFTYDLSV